MQNEGLSFYRLKTNVLLINTDAVNTRITDKNALPKPQYESLARFMKVPIQTEAIIAIYLTSFFITHKGTE